MRVLASFTDTVTAQMQAYHRLKKSYYDSVDVLQYKLHGTYFALAISYFNNYSYSETTEGSSTKDVLHALKDLWNKLQGKARDYRSAVPIR